MDEKFQKKLDRRVKTVLLIPHNPGFVPTPEMTLLGGRWDPSEGSSGDSEVKNEKNSKRI